MRACGRSTTSSARARSSGAALDDVGLLDERIFYGPEDDLCLRLHRAVGVSSTFRCTVVPEQRVTRKFLSVLTARHLHGLGYYFWKYRYF
jgi:hypothetical protein